LLLGHLLMASVLAFEADWSSIHLSTVQWSQIGGAVVLLLSARIGLGDRQPSHFAAKKLQLVLILATLFGSLIVFLAPGVQSWPAVLALFLTVLAEEAIGRWLFYEARG
jgi:DMSO reductase anchor subunit